MLAVFEVVYEVYYIFHAEVNLVVPQSCVRRSLEYWYSGNDDMLLHCKMIEGANDCIETADYTGTPTD